MSSDPCDVSRDLRDVSRTPLGVNSDPDDVNPTPADASRHRRDAKSDRTEVFSDPQDANSNSSDISCWKASRQRRRDPGSLSHLNSSVSQSEVEFGAADRFLSFFLCPTLPAVAHLQRADLARQGSLSQQSKSRSSCVHPKMPFWRLA